MHHFRLRNYAFIKVRTIHGQPPQRLTPEMEGEKVHDLREVTKEPEIQIEGFFENIRNWTKRTIFLRSCILKTSTTSLTQLGCHAY